MVSWNVEEINILKKSWEDGKSLDKIHNLLPRHTISGIKSMVFVVAVRRPERWSTDDITILKSLRASRSSCPEIAKRLGRTNSTIKNKLHRLNVKLPVNLAPIDIPETTKAYFAGLFDGEGCVYITTHKGGCNYNSIMVTCANTDRRPLDIMVNIFRGGIAIEKPRKPNHKTKYTWRAYHHQAIRFLKTVLPYLVIKKEKALQAIQLQEQIVRKCKGEHIEL